MILIPDRSDYDTAVAQVQQILADAMQELTPDIPISTEYLLADRWYKDVDANERERDGRIIPFSKTDEQPFSNACTLPARDAIEHRRVLARNDI